MKYPFWVNLILAWKTSPHRTGLTLPYIVGADARRRKVQAGQEDVEQILNEIRHHTFRNRLITISRCPDIRGPIINVVSFARMGTDIDLDDSWGATEDEKYISLASVSWGLI